MVDLVEELKQRARVLHGQARQGVDEALKRMRVLAELKPATDAEISEAVRRRHALAVLATELGFRGWPHAKSVLRGENTGDLGTLMFRDSGGGFWNVWSAAYDEAVELRAAIGGYLLPYRHQFAIVEAPFIEFIELDPDDPDWERIGRDWVRPADRFAWTRLAAKAIDAKLTQRGH